MKKGLSTIIFIIVSILFVGFALSLIRRSWLYAIPCFIGYLIFTAIVQAIRDKSNPRYGNNDENN